MGNLQHKNSCLDPDPSTHMPPMIAVVALLLLHTCLPLTAGIASFATVSPLAAALFAPTQVWVSIAWKLNCDIVKLNKQGAS